MPPQGNAPPDRGQFADAGSVLSFYALYSYFIAVDQDWEGVVVCCSWPLQGAVCLRPATLRGLYPAQPGVAPGFIIEAVAR